MNKSVEFMTEKEMDELSHAASRIAEKRKLRCCFSSAGISMPWKKLGTYPDSGVMCSPTKRKKILNSIKHHRALKRELLMANEGLPENIKIRNLKIVADAERKAAKEADPKKAAWILVEAAIAFQMHCVRLDDLDHVNRIPFLTKTEVSSSPEEYGKGRLTAEKYERIVKLMPREDVNPVLKLRLQDEDERRQQYFDCHGVAYYRLTKFGRWFISNPGLSLNDCRELCSQYERGEDMCYEKFSLNEAEKALVLAASRLREAQEELARRENTTSQYPAEPDW